MSEFIDSALNEFGQNLGFKELAFDAAGLVHIDFEHKGAFFIEKKEEHMLVYLMRPVDTFASLAIMKSILTACHYKKNLPFHVQVAMTEDDSLVLSIFAHPEEFTASGIASMLDLLARLHDQARN